MLPIMNLRAQATDLGPQELHALPSEIINDVNSDGQRWISGAVVLRGLQTALHAARYPCRLPSNSKEATLASL